MYTGIVEYAHKLLRISPAFLRLGVPERTNLAERDGPDGQVFTRPLGAVSALGATPAPYPLFRVPIALRSHPLANFRSRVTVAVETSSVLAASSCVSPPK